MKTKRILCALMCLVMLMGLPFAAGAIADPELGTSENIFPPLVEIIEVDSKADFNAMREDPTGYYRLTADLHFTAADFANGGFEPIPTFSGVLDGDGHTISGLIIKGAEDGRTGLFAENRGTICDLRMKDAKVEQDDVAADTISRVGVFCGSNFGKIIGCSIYGTLTAKIDNSRAHVGGLTGHNSGTIKNCAAVANIKVNRNTNAMVYLGGIAGSNEYWSTGTKNYKASISCCYSNVQMSVNNAGSYTATVYSAAIVGLNQNAIVEQSYYPAERGNAAAKEEYTISAVDGYVGDCAGVAADKLGEATSYPALMKETYWRMAGEPVLNQFACYDDYDHAAAAEPVVTKEATCYQNGTGNILCELCSAVVETGVVIPATGKHDWATGWTQGENGHYHKCQTNGCTAKDGETAHTAGEVIVDQEPDCKNNGVGHKECTACGKVMEPNITIQSTGNHAYTVEVAGTKKPATCMATGTVTMKCNGCDATQIKVLEKDPANHTGNNTVVGKVEPTCGADGYSGDTKCECGAIVANGKKISATGKHTWDGGKVTAEPTTKKEGVKTFTCTSCGGTKTEKIAKLPEAAPKVNFTDVKKSDFFYTPVQWAVANGVTTGTSKTTFGPNESCTRAQAVTFLWRAAGSPAPKSSKNPFTDVKKNDYFYKAVLWAAEKGVTSGTSATKFSPNDVCTRGQIVAFLWRSQGSKKVSASNPFKDVKKSDYYYNAVLWAVKNNVTTGTSKTTFGPSENCTRGQIVTFLYRAIVK